MALSCMAMLFTAGCGSTQKDNAQPAAPSSKTSKLIADIGAQMEKEMGTKPKTGQHEKIGILISSTSNEFWGTMKQRYEEAGKELGVDVKVFEASTEKDAPGQLDAMNTMVPMGFKAIILSPINGTNLIPGIVAANSANIPVVNLGPGVKMDALQDAGGHLDGRITVNFEDQGKLCAQDMVKRLKDGGDVAIIGGLDGAAQSEGRVAGAKAVFAGAANINLVAAQSCDWDAEKAYEATKDILTAHPDVKGIFAANDNMALAAVRAIKEMNKKDVLVYGVDFTSAAKAAIQDGSMAGSMTYSSTAYTKAAIEMAMVLAQGGKFDKPIYLPLTLVTKDNIGDFSDWR